MTALYDHVIALINQWRTENKKPLIVGVCGSQGSGKSTLCEQLRIELQRNGLHVAVLSLDDLYLSPERRIDKAKETHPLFATRGVPGTHDVSLGVHTLGQLKNGFDVLLPRFDKANNRPFPLSAWQKSESSTDVVLFEGWCVGMHALPAQSLPEPCNILEREEDADGMWRKHVNEYLGHQYVELFSFIDKLIMLTAPDFPVVTRWRLEQEQSLRAKVAASGVTATRLMEIPEIERFVQFFERWTRYMLNEMPSRADLLVQLDADRNVIKVTP